MDYQFEILLGGEMETVFVHCDGESHYSIFKGDEEIGKIYSEVESDGVKWKSDDLIAPSIIKQIGEKIESLDL